MNLKRLLPGLLCLMTASLLGADAALALLPPSDTETKNYACGDFNYSLKFERRNEFHSVYRLDYPALGGRALFGDAFAYYYLPADAGRWTAPRPCVICLNILGDDGSLAQMLCANFASNGIPAMACFLPMNAGRCPGGGRKAMMARPDAAMALAEAMRLSPPEVSRAVDILLSRPEIDGKRIGLLGVSLGGITAATATARDKRIDKAAIVLAGGDLDKIIGHSPETDIMRAVINRASPEDRLLVEKTLSEADPLNNAAGLRERAASGRLLMVNAAEDEVIPAACSSALAERAGMSGKAKILPGLGHYTAVAAMPQMLGELTEFFGGADIPKPKPPPAIGDEALKRGVCGQLAKLARLSPTPGRCIFIDLSYKLRDLKTGSLLAEGQATALRGEGRMFKLSLRPAKPIGGIKRLDFGFDGNPWMLSSEGLTYSGSLEPCDEGPESYIDPQLKAYGQLASGILDMGASGMLDALERWCKLSVERDAKGVPSIVGTDGRRTTVRIRLSDSGNPELLTFSDSRISIEIAFRHFELDAPSSEGAFSAPSSPDGKPAVAVKRKRMDMMIASVFNLLSQEGL